MFEKTDRLQDVYNYVMNIGFETFVLFEIFIKFFFALQLAELTVADAQQLSGFLGRDQLERNSRSQFTGFRQSLQISFYDSIFIGIHQSGIKQRSQQTAR